MEKNLYDASLRGSVDSLNTLIQQDKLILDRVSLTCFNETPLHIAAMRGHSDFARLILSFKPKLAMELDSSRRSPLHIASSEGHVEIVRDLLSVSSADVCLDRDEDGRTPLHLAAMKGRVEVIEELIKAKPESIREKLYCGETVLHLCVQYNQFEALKLLVELARDDDFINSTDHDGDTILHLAVILKQTEITKYLLSITSVKVNANSVNRNRFTALDVLELFPKDFKALEIRVMLMEAGVQRAKHLKTLPSQESLINLYEPELKFNASSHFHPSWSKAGELLSTFWKRYRNNNSNWIVEARGNLTVAATLTAAMAFQAGISPPGGCWQETSGNHEAGGAIQANVNPSTFRIFILFNTLSLIASMSIILLMVSGFPLKNKLSVWLLGMTMCFTVAFTTLAYLFSMLMLVETASTYEDWRGFVDHIRGALFFWIGFCGVAIFFPIVDILAWLINKMLRFIPQKLSNTKAETVSLVKV